MDSVPLKIIRSFFFINFDNLIAKLNILLLSMLKELLSVPKQMI